MVVKIRKAKKEDLKEISKILMEESSKIPYNEKYTLKIALKEINKCSKNDLYVAVDKKEIIGFIASNITPDNKKKAHIKELWLKKSTKEKELEKFLLILLKKDTKRKMSILLD